MTDTRPERIKFLARGIAHCPDPELRRKVCHMFVGELYLATLKAYPELQGIEDNEENEAVILGVNMLQEIFTQANNREVPDIFRDTFKPAHPGGRPPLSREKQAHWAYASAVVTVLMEEYGLSENDAAKKVARHLESKGVVLPTTSYANREPWERLQHWRDKCRSGKKGKFAASHYDHVLMAMGPGTSNVCSADKLMDILDPPFLIYELR